MLKLDPFDDSNETKRRKPLAKKPGRPYKMPIVKGDKASLDKVSQSADDIFGQHLPDIKPPVQMPPGLADHVSVEFSEQMMDKFDDTVLAACGRKSQLTENRRVFSEAGQITSQTSDEQNFLQPTDDGDDSSSVGEGVMDHDDMGDLPVDLDLPPTAEGMMNDIPTIEPLPDMPQSLEDLVPQHIMDESRIKRIHDWDRYVEKRLLHTKRTPFDVNEYCEKMVAVGKEVGQKKWFTLESKLKTMAEAKTTSASDLHITARQEAARSLVSLLFLANAGNIEFKSQQTAGLEVRLLSDTINRIQLDDQGLEFEGSPTKKVAKR